MYYGIVPNPVVFKESEEELSREKENSESRSSSAT